MTTLDRLKDLWAYFFDAILSLNTLEKANGRGTPYTSGVPHCSSNL